MVDEGGNGVRMRNDAGNTQVERGGKKADVNTLPRLVGVGWQLPRGRVEDGRR